MTCAISVLLQKGGSSDTACAILPPVASCVSIFIQLILLIGYWLLSATMLPRPMGIKLIPPLLSGPWRSGLSG